MGAIGVLLAFGTALSFTLMNFAIRQGGRAHPGESAVLPTIIVNAAAFSLIFGVAASHAAVNEPDPFLPPFLILAALTMFLAVVGPAAAAVALRSAAD